MDKQKRAKCPNGTRKFKPLGDGCYTDEQIENHKKTKKRKEEPSVLKIPVSSQNKTKKKKHEEVQNEVEVQNELEVQNEEIAVQNEVQNEEAQPVQ